MDSIDRDSTAPSPDQLEREIEDCQAQFLDRLHAWLASLEGKRFPSLDECRQTLSQISHIVRKAGRQLLFNGEHVWLTASRGTRQKSPSVAIRTRREGKSVHVTSSTSLPKLRTTAIE